MTLKHTEGTRQFGELKITVQFRCPAPVRVDWIGTSDQRQPDLVLKPFFSELTAEAEGENVGINMHFDTLQFFNSATVTFIIRIIKQMNAKKIKLKIFFDVTNKWQRILIDTLSILCKGDGFLEIVSR